MSSYTQSGYTRAHSDQECDSLADGDQRRLREDGKTCECKEGWGGINCNGETYIASCDTTYSLYSVCKTDNACVGFPLAGQISSKDMEEEVANMTCYAGGETVFSNHQMCDVTSKSPFPSEISLVLILLQTVKL